jgi:rare lipoprotein A (peptidoglycan hydrolase)
MPINAFKTALLSIMLLLCAVPAWAETLTASYYSISSLKQEGTYAYSHGIMANGKLFRDDGATCALNGYRLGDRVRVTNLLNGRSVIVTVTDRTAKRFTGKRIDLTISQMRLLDGIKWGLIKVEVTKL